MTGLARDWSRAGHLRIIFYGAIGKSIRSSTKKNRPVQERSGAALTRPMELAGTHWAGTSRNAQPRFAVPAKPHSGRAQIASVGICESARGYFLPFGSG